MSKKIKVFDVETPDGKTIKVPAPTDATDEQIIAQAQTMWNQAQKFPTNNKVGVEPVTNMADSFASGEGVNPFGNPADAHPAVNNAMTNLLGTYDKIIGAPVRSAISDPVGTAKSMLPQSPMDYVMSLIPGMSAGKAVGGLAADAAEPAKQIQKGDYSGALGSIGGATLAAMTIPAAKGMADNAGPVIRTMAQKTILPAPVLNSWMEVKPTDMMHGADPGAQIVKDKLLGATKAGTRANVETALADVGTKLESKLSAATATGATIDAETPLLDALSDAENSLSGGTDAAFQNKLTSVLDKVQKKYPNLKALTPSEAQELNKWLGDSIKWNGAAYEGEFNQALAQARGGISKTLKSKVPGLAPDLERWGNLFNATKALGRAIVNNKAGQGTSSLAATALKRAGVPLGAATAAGYAIKKLNQ